MTSPTREMNAGWGFRVGFLLSSADAEHFGPRARFELSGRVEHECDVRVKRVDVDALAKRVASSPLENARFHEWLAEAQRFGVFGEQTALPPAETTIEADVDVAHYGNGKPPSR